MDWFNRSQKEVPYLQLLSEPTALSHEPAANAEPLLREWGGFAATYSEAIPAMDRRDSQETPAFMQR